MPIIIALAISSGFQHFDVEITDYGILKETDIKCGNCKFRHESPYSKFPALENLLNNDLDGWTYKQSERDYFSYLIPPF